MMSMERTARILRVCAILACVGMLSSCGFFQGWFAPQARVGPTDAVYQAAMADFSTCQTSGSVADRQAASARLAISASRMAADTRPANADHFFMMDRVVAANARCAADLATIGR